MLNAHRDMPPVEDVAHGSANGTADQIWQRGFPVGDDGDRAMAIPSQRKQVLPELFCWRQGGLCDEAETAAHIGAFDLSNHNIEVPSLIFRPTSNMCTVQKDGQRRRRCLVIDSRDRLLTMTDFVGHPAQPIAHRGVDLCSTWKKRLHDTRRFSKRVTRTKFSLKTP